MIRVLFVENSTGLGGAQLALYKLLRFLNKGDIEPIVASVNASPLYDRIKQLSIDTRHLPQGSLRDPVCYIRRISYLVSLVRQIKPHIIFSNDYGGHLFGGIVATLCRVPEIWWVSGITPPSLSKTSIVQRVVATIPATRVVANSLWTKEQLKSLYGLHSSVIYCGIDIEGLKQGANGDRVRKELGIASDELIATIVGRLCSFKGQHIFLEAAALTLRRHPNSRFLIVGGTVANLEPEYPEFLARRARELGIEERVIMTGFQENVADYYAASDVIVHAANSRLREAFGLTIAEPMIFGKPVIATRCGGPVEIVEHSITGFLIEPDDPDPIAKYLDLLFEDAELRHTMGRAGYDRAARHFSIKKHIQEFENLVLELARESPL